MQVGDLVKYIPTALEIDLPDFYGVVVEIDGCWHKVFWAFDKHIGEYTADSLEVVCK